MTINSDIDWLTAVFPDGWRLQPLDGELPLSQWKPTNGGMGYNRGALDDISGIKMYWSTDRPGMGTCYVVSAQPLAKLAQLTGSTSYLFSALRIGFELAEATRLDVRVDIPDEGESIYELREQVLAHRVAAASRRTYIYESVPPHKGCTVYFGSKTSDSYVRCYDKHAESHGAVSASRIEVQLRRKKAAKAWRTLAGLDGSAAWTPVIQGIVRAHVESFGVDSLDTAIGGSEPFDFKVEKLPEVDTRRWLLRQVLPTFLKDALTHEGDPQLFDWFKEELRKRLHRE